MKFVARVDNIPTIINMTNHAFINLAGQVGKLFILFIFFGETCTYTTCILVVYASILYFCVLII